MKVVFSDEALRDLDQIFEFNRAHYPASVDAFQRRLRVTEHFYRIAAERIEVLHVAHAARREPWDREES
jgi:plasmid stabilization system protein ParE